MTEEKPKKTFWLGNAVLVVALIVLLEMGKLWAVLDFWAMVLWVALVGVGVYLLMKDKNEEPPVL